MKQTEENMMKKMDTEKMDKHSPRCSDREDMNAEEKGATPKW